MTMDDPERPFRTLFQNTCGFGPDHENFNEDRPILSAARCSAMTVISGNRRFMRIFTEVPWRRGVKGQWVIEKVDFHFFQTLRLRNLKK